MLNANFICRTLDALPLLSVLEKGSSKKNRPAGTANPVPGTNAGPVS